MTSVWSTLIGRAMKDVSGNSLVHRIEDAYSVVGGGRIGEVCSRSSLRFRSVGDVPVVDATVTCFACTGRSGITKCMKLFRISRRKSVHFVKKPVTCFACLEARLK